MALFSFDEMDLEKVAQWVNCLHNNIFVNPPLLCEISGALYLVLSGLTAGRETDEIQVNFENVICYRS